MNPIRNLPEPDPFRSSSQKIYTTGCRGRRAAELPQLLETLDAVLIDVRFAPQGKPIEWSKEYLKLLLKNKYLHVPSLGNRSSREGKTAIQNLSLGIRIVAELKVNVLLMCRCESEESCHRFQIINELTKLGRKVKEITN